MKILVVSQYFWPENFRINDIVEGLCQKGHEITVLTGVPNYPGGKLFEGYGFFNKIRDKYNCVKIYRVPIVPRGSGNKIRLVLNYVSFVILGCLLGPFFAKGNYDLIFVYEPSPITVMLPAILLKKIKKIPLFLWVLDLWPESLSATGAVNSSKILNWMKKLVRFIYRKCDKVLVQSQAFIPSIMEHGIPGNRICYFPSSAENLFAPVSRHKVGDDSLMPEGFIVMFAGNIGAAQSFETIVAAAKLLSKYKEIKFVILGDGRMMNWVRQEVQNNNLSDTLLLLGRFPLEKMNDFFSMADVMLVTLKKEYIFSLTIPGKVQSYLACGRPIVASLDGEGARIIDEAGAGLSSPAEDAESLADAILKMYNTPVEIREKMGQNGRAYFEKNFERNMLLGKLHGWMIQEVELADNQI